MMPMIQLHCNAVTGHDTNNDGLSEGAPFKTLSKLLSVATWKNELFLQSNINGEGDSRWRETLALPPGFRCRGIGDSRPLADSFDVAPNASFSAVDGREGVYQITWTHSITPGDTGRYSAREAGVPIRRAASLDALEAMETAGIYPGPVGSSTETIYMRASDGGNIVENGLLYEITARNQAVTLRAGVLSGVNFRGNGQNNGVGVFGGFSRVANCNFAEGTKHNLFMSGRSVFTNIICEDGDPSYNGNSPNAGSSTLFVGYGVPGLDLDLVNCIARRGYVFPEHAGNSTVAFYLHTTDDIASQWERVRVAGFRAESVGSTISAARSDYINWQVSGVTEVDVYEPGYPT